MQYCDNAITGNLLALPNGKLCYLDFGMVSQSRLTILTMVTSASVPRRTTKKTYTFNSNGNRNGNGNGNGNTRPASHLSLLCRLLLSVLALKRRATAQQSA